MTSTEPTALNLWYPRFWRIIILSLLLT